MKAKTFAAHEKKKYEYAAKYADGSIHRLIDALKQVGKREVKLVRRPVGEWEVIK